MSEGFYIASNGIIFRNGIQIESYSARQENVEFFSSEQLTFEQEIKLANIMKEYYKIHNG